MLDVEPMGPGYMSQKFNEWEVKQIIEVVSKAVNSVLMTKPETSITDIRPLANELMMLYAQMLKDLKEMK